jgi:hypothetical protein
MDYDFEKGRDYYLEDGKIIYTKRWLKKRGSCCGSMCRNCPFYPPYEKGNTVIEKDNDDEDEK